jgi:very-short-patch-repair endonuclease
MTVHEILWRAERARFAFVTPPKIRVENAKNVIRSDITRRLEALNAVRSHWVEVEPQTFSAWRGYSLHNFYQTDESDLEEFLSDAKASAKQLIEAAKILPLEICKSDVWTLGATSKLVGFLDILKNVPETLDQDAIAIASLKEATPLINVLEAAVTVNADIGIDKAQAASSDKPVGNFRSLIAALEKLSQLVTASPSTKLAAGQVITWRTTAVRTLTELEQACKRFLEVAKVRSPTSLREAREICDFARLAVNALPDLVAYAKPSMLSGDSLQMLTKAESESSKLAVQALALRERFAIGTVPEQKILKKVRRVLSVQERRFFRFLSSEFRWAKSQLLGFVNDIKSLPRGTWAKSVAELLDYTKAQDAYATNQEYRDRFGTLFTGTDTDWDRLRRLLSWIDEFRRTISNRRLLAVLFSCNEGVIFALGNEHAPIQRAFDQFVGKLNEALRPLVQTNQWVIAVNSASLPLPVKQWLLARDSRERAKILVDFAVAVQPTIDDLGERLKKLWSFGDCDEVNFFGLGAPDLPLPKLDEKLSACLTALPTAGRWADYCRAIRQAKKLGLEEIIDLIERGALVHDQAMTAYEYALYTSLAKTIIREHPLLRDFTRVSHEKVRSKFAELDRRILQLNRDLIAFKASNKKPPDGLSSGPVRRYTEMGLIYREINKKKRHVPIRQLVARAGRACQALKPCFMMGPLSVAQYLAPGDLEFDLVIMDEASQVKPEEALGAIARGKQIIIVGDPKQLPPTSFFDRLGEADIDEEEELALDDSESVLDICMQAYRPVRRLCWHYRSEHETLINFSNHEFYDKDLILFPSPVGIGHGLGIFHHYIKGALYENRRNKAEAEAAARAVLAHAQRHAELSLGVGTFNLQQKELIEDYIERMRSANPILEEFFERQNTNKSPFFVKNLENIQGDERDVIFISTTYGPDSSRRVLQRFGPINADSGWRRLNVIVTRAKKRTEVFTSMRSNDIVVSSSSSRGVRALRGYLGYAEKGGVVPTEVVDSGREPDSPFEEAVAQVLRQAGYSVVPQIGVAGFFIDIGVRHPSRCDEYILGVECDGAMYHSALSARDRDRLRQDVLESRGWKIHRIWSTDWFNNREAEIKRLLQRIEKSLKESGGTVEAVVTEPNTGDNHVSVAAPEQAMPVSVQESPRVRKGGLTAADVRQRLLDLYKNKILSEFPNHEKGILRKEMLEALLRNAPTTPEEFREFIPLKFREATDSNHMKFLPEILDILEQLVD